MNEYKGFQSISFLKSFLIFAMAGMIFYSIIKLFVPWLSNLLGATEYIIWIFAGTFMLFLPLFITTFFLLKKDGCKMKLNIIMRELNLKN